MAKRKADGLEGRAWVIPHGPFKWYTATVEGPILWRPGWHHVRITGPDAYNALYQSEDALIVAALAGGRAADVDGVDEMAPAPRRAYDVVAGIMAWEGGEMTPGQEAELFQHLIDTDAIRHLQGTYGRTAQRLISAGLVRPPAREVISDEQAADRRAGRLVDVAEVNEGIREGRKHGDEH